MQVYDISNNFQELKGHWSFGENYYWVICDAKEINTLLPKLQLDRDCVEECKNLEQSAKIIFFSQYLFIVFNILEHKKRDIISRELNIFLGKDFILTVYKEKSEILELLIDDIGEGRNCSLLKEIPKPSVLLYYILDRIIVRNYNIISSLETAIDKIELTILRNPEKDQARELIYLRRQVYKIKKYLNPLRYIGDSIVTNDNGMISEENLKYFESLNIKMEKLMQAQETLVQDLALVREAYESETANKTNELMKVFTIVAAVFLPLDLITGIFGLGLKGMPLADNNYGFYIILIIMVLIAGYLLYLFHKKKWL
jgi:magnesium transporter